MTKRKGFTLVELLVVIGIISLLISILLPSLSKARASAKSVVCLSNLRQLGLSVQMYAHDNRGSYPTRAHYSGDYPTVFRWVGNAGQGNYAFDGTARFLNKYLEISDSNQNAVWRCPEDQQIADYTGTSYGMNLATGFKSLYVTDTESVKLTAVKESSKFIVAAEHGGNQMAWLQPGEKPVDVLGKIDGKQVSGAPAMFWHHKTRTWNCLFADGHVAPTDIQEGMLTTPDYTYVRE